MKTCQLAVQHGQFVGRMVVAIALLMTVCTGAFAAGPGVHGRVYGMDDSGALLETVAGSQIELKNQAGAVVARATADPSGYYQADLPPGTYFYKVQGAGYQTEDQGRGFTLQQGEGYAVIDFCLVKGDGPGPNPTPPDLAQVGTLVGHVWEKSETGELNGIAAASLTLRKLQSRQTARTTTRGGSEDAGSYEVTLEEGRWQASVSAPGYQTFVDLQPIAIAAGKQTERNFILVRETPPTPAGQGIRGVIRVVGRPATDQALPPDTAIQITSAIDASKIEGPFPPGPGGNYDRALHPGQYRVQATATGYRPATSGIKNVLGGSYTVVNLALTPEHPTPPVGKTQLVVTVYGAHNKHRIPLEGAKVLIRKSGQALSESLQGTTDTSGEATIDLPATAARRGTAAATTEKYAVLARKEGYKPGGVEVDVTYGTINHAVITLDEEHIPVTPDFP